MLCYYTCFVRFCLMWLVFYFGLFNLCLFGLVLCGLFVRAGLGWCLLL